MRVITGSARKRKLIEPEDRSVRPTTDQVKESIFSIIQFDVPGRKVLDLFAGTGQLGIEALSRGAESCTFVDISPKSIALVKKNLTICNFKADVIRADSIEYIKSSPKFDIILIDPPYESGLYTKVLEEIVQFDILNDGGIIMVESLCSEEISGISEPYYVQKRYKYGKISLTMITKGN